MINYWRVFGSQSSRHTNSLFTHHGLIFSQQLRFYVRTTVRRNFAAVSRYFAGMKKQIDQRHLRRLTKVTSPSPRKQSMSTCTF